ncbi:DEHA2B04510p [Debaryomyces hansenii CBS767]|uniref:DEHA2B04510p n=1 Tax=Debaryomyces hansenii (strain ATCC 36239 / CBS 767 / BCRC 21394 / JCM 1990 / NBRC 0083 / IGC 2968) TaxID=284592 RepID=Q6BXB1_DEBHA|nr:DEHA2B04510p [Debaryomyces hansenii CBS767]CAG85152.1 DEHA2B04510p [Debaryomyces hansenii CBS767]|eukprot:XP_457158.1 DEHA2B04510p [Debaryomyces hansenii CBS767]
MSTIRDPYKTTTHLPAGKCVGRGGPYVNHLGRGGVLRPMSRTTSRTMSRMISQIITDNR